MGEGRMIVGVSGWIGSGKDAAVRRLVAKRGFTQLNMAAPLKAEVLRIMPRTVSEILRLNRWPLPQDPTQMRLAVYDEKPPGIRELLQEWGTDLRRAEDPDYWVRQWKATVQPHRDVCASDVRFQNEAMAIKDLGGVVLRITRPGTIPGDHVSERAIDAWPFDAVIQNDGTIEDLWDKIDTLTT